MTLADFQYFGIIVVSADLLKMWLRGPQRMSARVHRSLECRRSGPSCGLVHIEGRLILSCGSSLKLKVSSVLHIYIYIWGAVECCSVVHG